MPVVNPAKSGQGVSRGTEILEGQIRTLYRHAPGVYLVALVVACVTGVVLWDKGNHDRLVAWVGITVVLTLVRLALVWRYFRIRPTGDEVKPWAARAVVGAWAAGLLWGGGVFWLYPTGSLVGEVYVLLVVAGMLAGAVSSLTPYLPAFNGFFIPTSLGVAAKFGELAMAGGTASPLSGIGILFVVFAIALYLFGRSAHATLRDSLSVRFENVALAVQLAHRKHDLELANAALRKEIDDRERAECAVREAHGRVQAVVDNLPVVLWAVDREGMFTLSEGRGLKAVGVRPGEVVGQSVYELYGEHHPLVSAVGKALAGQATSSTVEINGTAFETLHSPQKDASGEIVGALGVSIDITERNRAEERLHLANKMVESTAEGIVVTDRELRVVWANPAFSAITGYAQEEVMGKKISFLQSGRHDRAFYAAMWDRISNTGSWQGEIWNRAKNGKVFPEWLNIAAVRNDLGEVTHYVGIFTDISVYKASQDELERLANYDKLTGLPNRNLFHDRLQHALDRANRLGQPLAVMFVDLDNFKMVNDTLGHDAGDLLLQIVGQRLLDCLREEDTVARFGGDEFVALVEEVQEPDLLSSMAGRMVESLAAPLDIRGHEVFITPSIGVALYPDDGRDAAALLKNADTAMYQAKDQGKNGYRFFTREMNRRTSERMSLENALRRALEKGELALVYQPQVDIATGRTIGLEALLRWHHPERGLVPPGVFIPIAEACGLILPIGEWVLETACREICVMQQGGMSPLRVGINLSARQFRHKDLVSMVRDAIRRAAGNPEGLELEITESAVMDDADAAVRTLNDLKDLGIHLAIDDFGTGYSSLSYLKRFPIDRLKIDQAFVGDLPHDGDDAAIATAIITMGHSLKMKVIAEGVETMEQLDFLAAHGCDEAQGYYFSRPRPWQELAESLQVVEDQPASDMSCFPPNPVADQKGILG